MFALASRHNMDQRGGLEGTMLIWGAQALEHTIISWSVDHHIATHITELNIGGSVHISLALPDHLLLWERTLPLLSCETRSWSISGRRHFLHMHSFLLGPSLLFMHCLHGHVSSLVVTRVVCRYWGTPLMLIGLVPSVAVASLHISPWHSSLADRQVSGQCSDTDFTCRCNTGHKM